jgi:MoaA/NifB/PqqE/SkfB family radical SAM enzyme
MYRYQDIKQLHLEISSRCNANCPLCPRSFYGYPQNDGYVEHNMSLKEAQKIFLPSFVTKLNEIFINGNFGDMVMNHDTVDIIKYFRSHNNDCPIVINTNGGARNNHFWKSLAKLNCRVVFGIDGLDDTNHLYRQNVSYAQVIKNARAFIDAGGTAIWAMINFEHNKHQQAEAKLRADTLGFKQFNIIDHGRTVGPVFDHKKNLTHTLGNPDETNFVKLYDMRHSQDVLFEDVVGDRIPKTISCSVQKNKSVYVSSTGRVYPCCFLGFSPETFNNGNYLRYAHQQFTHMINNNSALEYDLETSIKWFNQIKSTWNIDSFAQGRLLICNDVCGQ